MTNRWHGKIGFGITKEIRKGIWKTVTEEKEYYGNIITVRQTAESQSYSTNDDIKINAKISILDDGFISVNCATIRYVEFMGTLWKVREVTPEYPRLVLTLGGAYVTNSDEQRGIK